MTDTFKPVQINEYFLKQIAAGLKKEIYDTLFKQIFAVLNDNSILNDKNTLINAIRSGRIYYENGAFKSSKPFSNAVAYELEKLGAKYRNGAYYIARAQLPLEIENTLALVAAREAAKVAALNSLLARLAQTVGELTNVRAFISKAAEYLFTKLQNDLIRTTQEGKVPIIELVRTKQQAQQVTKDYIDNMDYWVKNWKSQEISKMRADIAEMVKNGARTETIKKYFMNRWGIAERKAEFLARNESGIAGSVIKATHYQDMGCTHFMWLRSTSIEKRPLHLEYAKETGNQYGINGTNIFSFSDPPVIEQVKVGEGKNASYVPKAGGQKGLPGQTYNCSCNLVGIKNPQYYINRQKIENAKRNIFTAAAGANFVSTVCRKIKYVIQNRKQRNNYTWRYRRFGEGQEV